MEISGNSVVWRHIQRENELVTKNPLGHRAIRDIDEIMHRNRRRTDDPYIRATIMELNGEEEPQGEA